MAYRYMVMADVEEGITLDPNKVRYANNESQLRNAINEVTNEYANATVVVYEVHKLMRVRKRAEYQEYLSKNGEFVPV